MIFLVKECLRVISTTSRMYSINSVTLILNIFIGLKAQASLILEIILYKDMVCFQTTFHRHLQKPFCCLPIEFVLIPKNLGGPQFGL